MTPAKSPNRSRGASSGWVRRTVGPAAPTREPPRPISSGERGHAEMV